MSRSISQQDAQRLRAIPLFSACTDKELGKILHLADEVTVSAGSTIIRQGAFGVESYVIERGSCTVMVNDQEVATLADGETFGEFSNLDHHPRSATVKARTDTTMLVFGNREFSAALDEIPSVARQLLASMALRLREANYARIGLQAH